jgi:teichoic acid transport system ATP-binding protein
MYDLTSVTVISSKNTVGFYDMNSVITLEKMNEG